MQCTATYTIIQVHMRFAAVLDVSQRYKRHHRIPEVKLRQKDTFFEIYQLQNLTFLTCDLTLTVTC